MATPTTFNKLDVLNSALRLIGSPTVESTDTQTVSYQTAEGALKDAQFAIFGTNVFQYNTRRVFMTGADVNDPNYDPLPVNSGIQSVGAEHEEDSPAPSVLNYKYELPADFNLILSLTTKDGMYNLPYAFAGHTLTGNSNDSSSVTSYVELASSIPRLFTDHAEVQMTYSFVPNLLATPADAYASHEVLADAIYRMPDFLYEAVALYVAQAICIQLTGSEQRALALYERYQKSLSRARILEGRASPNQDFINENSSRILDSHNRYGTV
jgi:hypothetical protein